MIVWNVSKSCSKLSSEKNESWQRQTRDVSFQTLAQIFRWIVEALLKKALTLENSKNEHFPQKKVQIVVVVSAEIVLILFWLFFPPLNRLTFVWKTAKHSVSELNFSPATEKKREWTFEQRSKKDWWKSFWWLIQFVVRVHTKKPPKLEPNKTTRKFNSTWLFVGHQKRPWLPPPPTPKPPKSHQHQTSFGTYFFVWQEQKSIDFLCSLGEGENKTDTSTVFKNNQTLESNEIIIIIMIIVPLWVEPLSHNFGACPGAPGSAGSGACPHTRVTKQAKHRTNEQTNKRNQIQIELLNFWDKLWVGRGSEWVKNNRSPSHREQHSHWLEAGIDIRLVSKQREKTSKRIEIFQHHFTNLVY